MYKCTHIYVYVCEYVYVLHVDYIISDYETCLYVCM